MTYLTSSAAIVLLVSTTSCTSLQPDDMYRMSETYPTIDSQMGTVAPPMEPSRKVSNLDCRKASAAEGTNLRCQ